MSYPLTIVSLDDNLIDLWIIERVIQGSNIKCQIFTFQTADLATDFFSKITKETSGRIILLLDLYMPGIGGFEFLEKFSKLLEGLNVQVYVLTAYMSPNDHKRAEQFNIIKNFMLKPLTMRLVLENFKF